MHTTLFVRLMGCVLAATVATASPFAFAQSEPSGSRLGTYGGIWSFGTPGMTGPGTAPDGHGHHPGIMGRHGPGPGTIWPGHGFHAPGTVPGGFAFGPLGALDLSEHQVRSINRIEESLRKEHWDLLGRIQEQHAALRELHATEQTDPESVGEIHVRIGDLQRQMAESHARALNEVRGMLTPEQRRQLARMQHGPHWGSAHGTPFGQGGILGR